MVATTRKQEVEFRAQRDALGEALVRLGGEYPRMFVLSPDVSSSTRSITFKEAYPDRFVCTGIAEANTMGLAAGLVSWELIPVVVMYAAFASRKALDPLVYNIAYSGVNVKVVATHAGINVGPDGPSHQAIEDLGIVRSVPNLVVLTAADASEVEPALRAALELDGPVYIRLERAPMAVLNLSSWPYEIGKGVVLREGADVCLIGIGSMVWQSMKAAEVLAAEGISARVINMRSLKPIDRDLILAAAEETAGIVTAEDHNRHGGLYSAVAEVVAAVGAGRLRYVALEDRFAESGTCAALQEKYGLDSIHIAATGRELWRQAGEGTRG